jgi:hypothetical protein
MTHIGVLGIYGLYRQLLPPNQYPDLKLHASMWGVQVKTMIYIVVVASMKLILTRRQFETEQTTRGRAL